MTPRVSWNIDYTEMIWNLPVVSRSDVLSCFLWPHHFFKYSHTGILSYTCLHCKARVHMKGSIYLNIRREKCDAYLCPITAWEEVSIWKVKHLDWNILVAKSILLHNEAMGLLCLLLVISTHPNMRNYSNLSTWDFKYF